MAVGVTDGPEFGADRRRPPRRVALADLTLLVRVPGTPRGPGSPGKPPEALAFTAAEEAAALQYAADNNGRVESI